MFTIHSKTLVACLIYSGLVLVMAAVHQISILLVLVLLIWGSIFCAGITDLRNNIALICFLIAFFVFLLGRQVVYSLFSRNEVYSFLNVTNNYTYLTLAVALLGIVLGWWMSKNHIFLSMLRKPKRSFLDKEQYGNNYSDACKCMYYLCYIFSLIAVYYQIIYVRRVGYLASYTAEAGGAGTPGFVTYFSSFTVVALSLFLATFPTKKEVIRALVFYEIYAFLTLLTGQRYPFVGISMFAISYFVIRGRREKGWIKKRYFIYVLCMLPLLMVFLTAYDAIRLGNKFNFDGLANSLVSFLDEQGGSINVIRRTIYNAKDLSDMHLVSFGNTYSALFENFIARAVFGVKTFSGNTLERALNGHDYSARISLIAYGDAYLKGQGSGTSYIAELLHDFGLFGVALGSIFYGVVLNNISKMQPGNKLWNGIELAMMYYLYLSPRGGFDAFVGGIFRIYSIFLFAILILLAKVIRGTEIRSVKIVI